jgi:hypothetical protein
VKPETLAAWRDALGGRRFILTLGAGVVDAMLVWFGKITSADFVLVTSATVGPYIAAEAYLKARTAGPSPQ